MQEPLIGIQAAGNVHRQHGHAGLVDGLHSAAMGLTQLAGESGPKQRVDHQRGVPDAGFQVASLNIENIADNGGTIADLYRPEAPFGPFDCAGFEPGIIDPDFP